MNDATLVSSIRYLSSVYTAPRAAEILPVWRRAFKDIEKEELIAAMDRYMATDTIYFPKPGQLLALIPGHSKLDPATYEYPEFLDEEDGTPWYMHRRYQEAIGWRFEEEAEKDANEGSLRVGDLRRRVLGGDSGRRISGDSQEMPI